MGVRSILIKIVFFNPFVSCSRSAAAEREVKRSRYHANEAAGSGRSTSGVQGQDQKGADQEEVGAKPPPIPIPADISGVDSLSLIRKKSQGR